MNQPTKNQLFVLLPVVFQARDVALWRLLYDVSNLQHINVVPSNYIKGV